MTTIEIQKHLNRLGFPVKEDGVAGNETKQAVTRLQASRGLVPDGVVGPRTEAILVEGYTTPSGSLIVTLDQLQTICPEGRNLARWVAPLNNTAANYNITSYDRLTMFVAQLAHESGQFNFTLELASGKDYDTGSKAKMLGNTPEADGDGQLYKGRGPIQTTGKANYQAASREIFGDDRLLKDPKILEDPKFGMWASGFFWNRNNLNAIADNPKKTYLWKGRTLNAFEYLTTRINGGLTHIEDRKKFYARTLAVLK